MGVFQAGPYLTDPDCGTVTERSKDLKVHIAMVDNRDRMEVEAAAKKLEVEAKKLAAQAKVYEAETARLETIGGSQAGKGGPSALGGLGSTALKVQRAPMRCLTVEENCTESDWSFFTAEWGHYVAAVGLEDDDAGAV